MGRVVGVGGVFLKVADKDVWRAWYQRVLGVTFEGWGGAKFPHLDKGVTTVTPFAADTGYFAPSATPFMINFIVDDMDGVLAQARAAGDEPIGPEDTEFGRFAWLIDPAGVKVELWQPAPQPAA